MANLVGGDWNMTFIFPYTGNVIIPIDELIFFRGVSSILQWICLKILGFHYPGAQRLIIHQAALWREEICATQAARSEAGDFPTKSIGVYHIETI